MAQSNEQEGETQDTTSDRLNERLDMLLPLVDIGYFVDGIDVGRDGAKAELTALIKKHELDARIDELDFATMHTGKKIPKRDLEMMLARLERLKAEREAL